MRKMIAGLIAGLLLGISGTAVAASSNYWTGRGSGYSCEGVGSGFSCKSAGYKLGVTKSYIYIQRGSNGTTFACVKWQPWAECFEG